ncbi:MAG TPA: hypothetical protein VGX76_14215 [Pirellulales bacterium]|jgi:hypothetical protein|nr:hypothetical protein [Pirellulales bacterium]
MLASLVSVGSVASIGLAAFGVGRPIVRALNLDDDDPLAVGVWSLATGLVAAGLSLVALGLAGLLYKPLIGVLTLAAGARGVGALSRSYWRRQTPPSLRHAKIPSADSRTKPKVVSKPPRWLISGLLAMAGVAAAGSLVGAAAPPTAGDALCYHLELPKRILLERALVYLEDSDNSTYPLLVEFWYLWALALDGGVAAQLVHWALGLLLALAAVVLATPVLGRPWSWCVGCLVMLVPGVNNQMTAPMNDVGLAAFTTLALAAWWKGAIDDEGPRWYLMAGWMLGGALGTKYLALVFAAAWGLVAAFRLSSWRARGRQSLAGMLMIAIVAASASGVWYARAAWHTGNPVYPFLHEYLGAGANAGTAPLARGPEPPTLAADKAPLGRDLAALFAAPWQVTMHPERFGGRGHQLGVLFLATLPGLICCRRLRGLSTLLSISAVYLIGWLLLRQNVRFLLPLVPLLAVPVVWVWMEWPRLPRVPARLAAALTIGILVVQSALGAGRARGRVAVCLGLETRDDYLLRHEPTYRAAIWTNALLHPNARILSQEQRAFYFNVRMTRENIYRRRTGYDRQVTSAWDLSRRLAEDGFTHLLLAEASEDSEVHYNPTLSRLAGADRVGVSQGPFDSLTEYDFRCNDGTHRHYRLLKLWQAQRVAWPIGEGYDRR